MVKSKWIILAFHMTLDKYMYTPLNMKNAKTVDAVEQI